MREAAAARQQVLTQGSWMGELALRDKNDRVVVVRSSQTLVRDKHGRPQAVLVVDTDLTEQKQVAAQLMRAQRLESVGRLASGLAHDLNNILAPILMITDLLLPKLPDAEDRAMLELMKTNSQRGADIVRQLLLYGRGDSGQFIELDLRRQVKEIAKMAQETFPKSIRLETHLPTVLPTVQGDPTQIHQVLLNLCVNARDAMPQGGAISLGLERAELDLAFAARFPEARLGSYVVLKVVDNGTGIPPEIIDKIFDPFFTTKNPETGTGLGLSTVVGIVKGHNGFIQVQSHLGRGTEFLVYFPASERSPVETVDTGSLEGFLGAGELVLLVDDEELIRLQTSRWLESKGYRALAAGDGFEALNLYSRCQTEISVVLVDLWMPYMDGPTTINELRKINPNVRIIAMSGVPDFEQELRRAGTQVEAFLPKPWSPQQFLRVLRQALQPETRQPDSARNTD